VAPGGTLGAAAFLAAVAFAGPRWGAESAVMHGEGIDLALALDASLSMMATDERPNRLEKMKQEVRRLRALSPGDRFALLAFAGRSYILSPLTIDDGALDLFLDNLDPSVMARPGSSLERAIRQGTQLLLASKTASDRALVIMSDGEGWDDADTVIAAARRAAESGITLITVGFGTERGSTIPVRVGNDVVPKRDENNAVVVTRYSPLVLRAAAEAAGGTFIDAGATDKAGRIRRAIGRLRTQKRSLDAGANLTPRFQLFLLPALLLLLLDTIGTERRRHPPAAPAAATTAGALLLCLTMAAPAQAMTGGTGDADQAYRARDYARAAALYEQAIRAGDRSPRTLYNYGTALLAADSVARAVEPLERATGGGAVDPELRYRALFNLGLVQLRRGLAARGDSAKAPLEAAMSAYRRAIMMRPADSAAKWNYELALRKRQHGGGGGSGPSPPSSGGENPSPPQPPSPRPSGSLGERQAEQLLNSAAREEREVQGRKQRQGQNEAPPRGKDWR
jgi:Ca-activated chloride channel family protein